MKNKLEVQNELKRIKKEWLPLYKRWCKIAGNGSKEAEVLDKELIFFDNKIELLKWILK